MKKLELDDMQQTGIFMLLLMFLFFLPMFAMLMTISQLLGVIWIVWFLGWLFISMIDRAERKNWDSLRKRKKVTLNENLSGKSSGSHS